MYDIELSCRHYFHALCEYQDEVDERDAIDDLKLAAAEMSLAISLLSKVARVMIPTRKHQETYLALLRINQR